MALRSIRDVGDLRGKRILVRTDFNVPIIHSKVADDYRIRKSFSTINFLKAGGAKVILISHIESGEKTLLPVSNYLKSKYPEIILIPYHGDPKEYIEKMHDGEVILLENLRLHVDEVANNEDFAQEFASLADVYVNDAFSVSHRNHASIVSIPRFLPSFTGLLFDDELKHLSECHEPPHPFLFILGGAKFDTKVPLIVKFLSIANQVVVSGALANNLIRAKGYSIGESLIADGDHGEKQILENSRLVIPEEVTVKNNEGVFVKKINAIGSRDKISDAGPATVAKIRELIKNAKFILWNGPLGNYEEGFTGPTLEVAKAIAESGVRSVVGGGDTLAAIAELGLENKFSFVSTGGGAMLDYLANETLPGIEALKNGK